MTERHAYLVGGSLGLAAILLFWLLPKPQSYQLAAVLLTLIAGVYSGFAFRDGRRIVVLIENTVALGFCLVAVAGLWVDPIFLPAGYFAHGFWDLAHHRRGISTEMPHWFVPFCVVFDWMVGAFLIIWW